jgi:hypothetical protein
MNYAAAFLVLILLAAAVFWYAGGRRYYTGPVIEARAGEVSESDRGSIGVERESEKKDIV